MFDTVDVRNVDGNHNRKESEMSVQIKTAVKLEDKSKAVQQLYADGFYGFITIWDECLSFSGKGRFGGFSGSEPINDDQHKGQAITKIFSLFDLHNIKDFDIADERE